ncbi:glycosyltransferase [Desulfurococcaceae archaeon MEX13E-LK6-19]|nr:glycosyltransferase [Desulfurococcaceae archaeon MEX13E-LK6-19]
MIRISFVSTYPPTHCGVAEYTRMLAMSLKSIAPDSIIHVFGDVNCGEERFDEEARVCVYPVFEKQSKNYSVVLDYLSRINGVDVLHIQHEYGIYGDYNGILEAAIEARREGLAKKIVFTMHTVYHPLSRRQGALVFQKNLNNVDAVIVHSFVQEFELQYQGVDPIIIHRIPHGTLLNPYLGMPRHRLMSDLGIREDNIKGLIIVLPGFLRKDKGLDILLESLSHGDWPSKTTFIVAGEVRDPEVKDLVGKISSRINTVFLEKYLTKNEILKLIALADTVILPYRDKPGAYSVSGILHLSMGSLKPIIGTRVPRLLELYQFVPRLTVSTRNPLGLAKKIKWLYENYDYAVAYMTNLYGYAIRTHWLRMARRHLSLYYNILAS